MTIILDDKDLGGFVPFAVLVLRPDDAAVMVHMIHQTGNARSIPEDLGKRILTALLKPDVAAGLLFPAGGPVQ